MKRIPLFLVLSLLSSMSKAQHDINFDADWSYTHAGETKHITLPRAWNENYAYRVIIDDLPTDTVRYTKLFALPKSAKGKRVYVEFEGARQMAMVWLNGHLLGLHENGITAFGFDLTPYLDFEGTNRIEVLTDNSWNYHEVATNTPFQWSNRNFNANYGGLPKHVRLHILHPIHQTLPLYSTLGTTGVYVYATDINVPKRRATVNVESQVANESDKVQQVRLEVEVADVRGNRIARFRSHAQPVAAHQTLTLTASRDLVGLHFWSWGYGYLYSVTTRILVGKKVVDEVITHTGFRKTEFANGLFKLNDRTLMIHGYAQRTSNEWPAVGMSVPAWLSDYSNSELVRSGGNLVRWMHIAPWRQDVESCDRVGLLQAMPAGDAEKDVTGRRWEMRKEVMRDAIIYYRNSPSIIFYESGNAGVSEEHMEEMKVIRDQYDPYGGRAIGSREMLSSRTAEYGGEMLYINKSGSKPVWAMEYCRDEALRRYWDDWSYPYHKQGDGPLYRDADASAYNQNTDQFAIEHVRRWYDYWQVRPGMGKRVSSGGVKIVFSDTNTHRRGESNYRTSGVVDAMRLPKDSYFAHQVMWDGWVTPEVSHTHIVGHWNYEPGTVKPVYVVSDAPVVKLYLNGRLLANRPRTEYHFLHTFDSIPFEAGEVRAVSYDEQGRFLSECKLQTAKEPVALRLTPMTSPDGFLADGADMALVTVEVVDAAGRRCPLDNHLVRFSFTGPVEWRGGIARGEDNCILARELPVECGVNRVLLRSTTEQGLVTLRAEADGLVPATLTWKTVDPSALGERRREPVFLRDETPSTPSYTDVLRSVDVVSVVAGSNEETARQSIDNDEYTHWQSDGRAGNAWIRYELGEKTTVDVIDLKLKDWRSRSYALEVVADDGTLLWSGQTPMSLGYVRLTLTPHTSRAITLRLKGTGSTLENDPFGQITELDPANNEQAESGRRHELRIVECDLLTHVR